MVGGFDRHASALEELVEWWQDLSGHEINSRAVLLPVPPQWGRTCLLDQFAAIVEDDEALSIVVRVPGKSLPEGLGVQAQELRDLFSEARVEHRVAELLGVDRPSGVVQLGLGVGGLFVSPLAAQVGLLLAGVGVGAVGRWDDSPAGQEGPVARLARAVAATSASVPVVVVIDDADQLEPDLAVLLVENLIERVAGHVLVVAVVNLDGDLMSALMSRSAYGLTEGRVRRVDVDPGMDHQARVDLAAELCPNLPGAATRRIGQRTRTFTEVFAVASAERLGEVDAHGDDAVSVAIVDEVINAYVNRDPPSGQAVLLAWAGGVLHARQADRAADVLSDRRDGDGDVLRFESLVRLADPASPRLAEQVNVLAASKRHQLAQIMLDTASQIGEDPRIGLVDKVVAWQAAHRVRADLQNRARLAGVQCQLVRGLEDLGDLAAAYQVAHTALADLSPGGHPGYRNRQEHDELSAAVLRLAQTRQSRHDDPLIDATVAAAVAGGAAIGLEARIWAAIDLLGRPGMRERALNLTDQITAELNRRKNLGTVTSRWRLQLAFHAGRAGHPAIAQQLLAPMLNAPDSPEEEDAARAVLYAVGGPQADTRLQIIGLEAELAVLPTDADDDHLRVHHALAVDYGDLGYYDRALSHGQHELLLRQHIQGADHPDTLSTRHNIAHWTGESGDPAGALQLLQELLPDLKQTYGPDHPNTLSLRGNIARWTGQCGDPAGALRLLRELLPDLKQTYGPDHPNTFSLRGNMARWTGKCGDRAGALRLYRALLPDRERILGPDHPDTLTTRSSIADNTGECGDPAGALRLAEELLPDQERILGPDHPDTLATRISIATWTGKCGDPAGALRLAEELLPDQERILGPDHPDTLTTRNNIAVWTGECGNPFGALRLFQEMMPDQERVQGLDHPDTLITRCNIATWTGKCGDLAGAQRLYRELLPDLERVLGPDHPDTLIIRRAIE
jgi:Tetratricopeptide repeat